MTTSVSGQLDSHHFFRSGDLVRAADGRVGTVDEGWALFAVISWDNGERDEVDQFDPTILVVQRASAE